MRKLFMAALFIACTAPFTFAQTASGSDYNKYDIYAGFSHDRVDIDGREGFNGVEGAITGFTDTDNGFAAVIGGGLDFRVSPRVDFRAIQFDYNPTHFSANTQHNFRIGVGIIFR